MKIRSLPLIGLAAALLLGACASKPPATPEPEPQVVEPVPEPAKEPEISLEELAALHARVVALRKDAFELGLKDVMPSEYADAEARYVAGKTALDADDRPAAKAELEAAEPLFARLVAEGGLKVAEGRKADALAARDRALWADAETLSPEALAAADAANADADAALAAGDAKAAIAAYRAAILAYDAAEKRSTALSVKSTVDELEYGPMDPGNYELAGQKLAAIDSLLATDGEAARDAAEEALLRYRLVLAKGWELTAGKRREAAERYKLDAEAIKAQVAVKSEYAEAKAVWDSAVAASSAGDNESAAPLYEQSEYMFEAVYQKAAEKRAAAEAAIQAAREKNERSAAVAERGDEQLGVEPEAEAEDQSEAGDQPADEAASAGDQAGEGEKE
ncbi:MAG TPA: hypothetical protein P5298_03940 [Spirochaetia bacterium]|nr:hypothetical protein [Spirochaetia bacterium]